MRAARVAFPIAARNGLVIERWSAADPIGGRLALGEWTADATPAHADRRHAGSFSIMRLPTMPHNGEEKRLRCPICGKRFSPRESDALPFCSGRCRNIDLYRWLKEDYALPLPPRLDDEEDELRRDADFDRDD
ncbi:hypothetical protein JCM17478_30730 [Thermopirellula anaerolimosa]